MLICFLCTVRTYYFVTVDNLRMQWHSFCLMNKDFKVENLNCECIIYVYLIAIFKLVSSLSAFASRENKKCCSIFIALDF